MNSAALNRTLIIRPGAIGDCILALPAMEYLANAADTEIWVPKPIVRLIQFGRKVRAISSTGLDLMGVGDLTTGAGLAACLKSFDHIVSWYGANRPELRAAMEALGVPCDFYAALPSGDDRRHASDFFAAQVGAPLAGRPRIRVDDIGSRDAIVAHPFSGSKRKNWPLGSYLQLASRLEMPVEWCAGPEEPLRGATRCEDLAKLATWIAGARLFIGNDSGITHLAAAAGVPVIAIFVSTDPEVWAPRGSSVTVLRNPSVEQVAAEVNRLLG